MTLLIVWLACNVCMFVAMMYILKRSATWQDVFLYPSLNEKLDQEEVGTFGKGLIIGLLTLMFLPAVIVYFLFLLILVIIFMIVYSIVEKIKRR